MSENEAVRIMNQPQKSETPLSIPMYSSIILGSGKREKGPFVYILHERPRLYGMAGIRIRIF